MSSNAYEKFFRRSLDDPEGFWAEEAARIYWHKPWERVMEYDNPPFSRWFVGGETNLCYNALDRHLAERGDQNAIVWISTELGQTRNISYRELHGQVNRYAAVMREQGLGKGDRAIIYLPMIPEALVAMLACVRLGAIHSVVFGGFAAKNLAQRIDDARPKLLITSDAGMRGGKPYLYKHLVDR
ncbi:MAG: AMP-binding protein, partial [bacterium]